MAGRAVHVLLVEDNVIDQEAFRRAFQRERIGNPITTATDGLEALALLQGSHGADPLGRPYLILLDLNMPRMNGLEFLTALRADPSLKDSVVFVLTTSRRDEDRVASYDLNVAGYIVKSDVGAGFVRLIALLDHYSRVVELP